MDCKGNLLVGESGTVKSESVVVRPYFQLPLHEMDGWLNAIECRFGDEDDFAIRESVTVSPSARTSPPCFRISPLPTTLAKALETCDLRLVVAISDEGRKMQKVVRAADLTEFNREMEFECRVPAGIDWTSPQGAILSLLLCSGEKSTRELGIPFRKSSTVAARHIGINRNLPGEDFPVSFLTEQQFKDRHYHPRSLALVEITPDDLQSETVEETNIRVLVHEDLKGVLALGPTSKKGRLAQQIVMESVMNQIAELAVQGDYEEGTLGHRLKTKLPKRVSGIQLANNNTVLRGATQGSFHLVENLRKL